MRAKRLLLATILFTTACQTSAPLRQVAPNKQFRIIAYVYGRGDLSAISAQKLTHINYAFAKVNPLGIIEFENPNAAEQLAQLRALKAKNPNLKLLVSVGGWGADFFSDAALSEASRCRFADSAIRMLNEFALDGIDLDWEYPGQPGPGIIYRPEDKQNFTLMLKTLRDELDMLSDVRGRKGFDRYALTIASAGGDYFEHTEMDRLHQYLDWINVMTYDLAGNWSQRTGHHTALYRSPAAGSDNPATAEYIEQHLRAGIPPQKIVVGAAFFGKGWIRAEGLNRRFDRYEAEYPYRRLVRDYLNSPGWERKWDRSARAPYLWNAEMGRLISYDDPQSLREKAKFVKERGLGGIMYWENSHDVRETLLDALYVALR